MSVRLVLAWWLCACFSVFVAARQSVGGEPGEAGANLVRRTDGRLERLHGCDQTVLEAGEAIVIVTPTGGGFGCA